MCLKKGNEPRLSQLLREFSIYTQFKIKFISVSRCLYPFTEPQWPSTYAQLNQILAKCHSIVGNSIVQRWLQYTFIFMNIQGGLLQTLHSSCKTLCVSGFLGTAWKTVKYEHKPSSLSLLRKFLRWTKEMFYRTKITEVQLWVHLGSFQTWKWWRCSSVISR